MEKLDKLDWKNYYVVRRAFDNKYTLQGTVDKKRCVLLKLMAAYNQGRFDWVSDEAQLKDLVLRFEETVGTHNFIMFMLWFSRQEEFDSVVKNILQSIPATHYVFKQTSSMDELVEYIGEHSELLHVVPTVLVPGAVESINGDRFAALMLRVAHDATGANCNQISDLTKYKIRTALMNLAEVTPVAISDLSMALCTWCSELDDADLVSDFLYTELLNMFDITMKYDNLSEVLQKNRKLLSF